MWYLLGAYLAWASILLVHILPWFAKALDINRDPNIVQIVAFAIISLPGTVFSLIGIMFGVAWLLERKKHDRPESAKR